MIYITKQKIGYIKVSNNPKDCEGSEILYYLDSDSLSDIYRDLRPFIVLNLGDGWYKDYQEVFDYFTGDYIPESLSYVYKIDIDMVLSKFNENFSILKKLGYIKEDKKELKNRDRIIYRCDIINALEDTYNRSLVKLVQEFSRLSEKTKMFLSNLCNRDLEYFKRTLPELLAAGEDVISFLPEYYKIYYKTFKLGDPELQKKIQPEFKIDGALGEIKESTNLDEIIYTKFELGKVYSGTMIKTILQEIYSKLEIKRTAKIVDIFDYFEVVKVNLNKESSYRMERRKII